jgi:hypothetical protein
VQVEPQNTTTPPSRSNGSSSIVPPDPTPPAQAVLTSHSASFLKHSLLLRRFAAKYFVQLDVEYESLCPDEYKKQHEGEVAALRGANEDRPAWLLNHRLEYLLLGGLPEPILRQRVVVQRARLLGLAGADGAAIFSEAFAAPKPDAPVDRVRSEALGALMEIQRLRHVQSEFERLRNRLIAISMPPGFAFVYLAIFRADLFPEMPLAAVAAIFGLLGGYLSVLLRISSLRWALTYAANYQQVDRLFWNVALSFYLSLLEGSLGAIILYVMFSSAILKESIFPSFPLLPGNPLPFVKDVTHAVEAQLMLWSVVAGFSERIVPDFLSGLGRELMRKQSSGGAPSGSAESGAGKPDAT